MIFFITTAPEEVLVCRMFSSLAMSGGLKQEGRHFCGNSCIFVSFLPDKTNQLNAIIPWTEMPVKEKLFHFSIAMRFFETKTRVMPACFVCFDLSAP
ncbi:MAG: hypothetical protein IJL47_01085 [Lachnospiraceae bacterium]|nr:hypothetical protein [Lachnospiraceae bacterium]